MTQPHRHGPSRGIGTSSEAPSACRLALRREKTLLSSLWKYRITHLIRIPDKDNKFDRVSVRINKVIELPSVYNQHLTGSRFLLKSRRLNPELLFIRESNELPS